MKVYDYAEEGTPKSKSELVELAKKAIYESWHQDSCLYSRGEFVELSKDELVDQHWTMTIAHTRDSELLTESNYQSVKKELFSRFPKDTFEANFHHWAVGWIEYIYVRALTDKGNPTKAFKTALEINEYLREVGVFDDQDYSDREYEATIENIRYVCPSWALSPDVPDNWANQVFSWLFDNMEREVENMDDRGGYPSEEAVIKALYALELLDKTILDDDREEIAEKLGVSENELPWAENYGVREAIPMDLPFNG